MSIYAAINSSAHLVSKWTEIFEYIIAETVALLVKYRILYPSCPTVAIYSLMAIDISSNVKNVTPVVQEWEAPLIGRSWLQEDAADDKVGLPIYYSIIAQMLYLQSRLT